MDYISNTNNLSFKLFSLMWEILGVRVPKERGGLRVREREKSGREREFVVGREELSGEDVGKIMQLYRVDYQVCFFFFLSLLSFSLSFFSLSPFPPLSLSLSSSSLFFSFGI